MTPILLDANVLIALLWARHQHHDAAQRWFAGTGRRAWATCAQTELAFVRITSNPAFSPEAVRPAQAREVLEANLSHPGHRRFIDRWGVATVLEPFARHLQGHQQLADAYLLGLAQRHHGRLASFDEGLRSLSGDARLDRALELVPTD